MLRNKISFDFTPHGDCQPRKTLKLISTLGLLRTSKTVSASKTVSPGRKPPQPPCAYSLHDVDQSASPKRMVGRNCKMCLGDPQG